MHFLRASFLLSDLTYHLFFLSTVIIVAHITGNVMLLLRLFSTNIIDEVLANNKKAQTFPAYLICMPDTI